MFMNIQLRYFYFNLNFVIFINQMFGSSLKSIEQKPLNDANFLSVYVYVYKYMYVLICLQASRGRCAKTMLSSYWLCEIRNKLCSSCMLMTKHVTQTNYYDMNCLNYNNWFDFDHKECDMSHKLSSIWQPNHTLSLWVSLTFKGYTRMPQQASRSHSFDCIWSRKIY